MTKSHLTRTTLVGALAAALFLVAAPASQAAGLLGGGGFRGAMGGWGGGLDGAFSHDGLLHDTRGQAMGSLRHTRHQPSDPRADGTDGASKPGIVGHAAGAVTGQAGGTQGAAQGGGSGQAGPGGLAGRAGGGAASRLGVPMAGTRRDAAGGSSASPVASADKTPPAQRTRTANPTTGTPAPSNAQPAGDSQPRASMDASGSARLQASR